MQHLQKIACQRKVLILIALTFKKSSSQLNCHLTDWKRCKDWSMRPFHKLSPVKIFMRNFTNQNLLEKQLLVRFHVPFEVFGRLFIDQRGKLVLVTKQVKATKLPQSCYKYGNDFFSFSNLSFLWPIKVC